MSETCARGPDPVGSRDSLLWTSAVVEETSSGRAIMAQSGCTTVCQSVISEEPKEVDGQGKRQRNSPCQLSSRPSLREGGSEPPLEQKLHLEFCLVVNPPMSSPS